MSAASVDPAGAVGEGREVFVSTVRDPAVRVDASGCRTVEDVARAAARVHGIDCGDGRPTLALDGSCFHGSEPADALTQKYGYEFVLIGVTP